MLVERAGIGDVDALVELRLDYLREDHGALDERDARAIREALPGYFRAHLGRDLFAYVAREGEAIAACALLLVVEKPMSPAFINGRTGMVLNVYTRPACRRRGYGKMIMEALLRDAREMALSVVELKATDAGYPLDRAVGFEDDGAKYRGMKCRGSEESGV